MNICILTTSFPAYTGDPKGRFIEELAEGIARKEKVVVLAPMYKRSAKKEELRGNLKIRRVQYFFPRKLQRLVEGSNIFHEFWQSPLAMIQFPFLIGQMIIQGILLRKEYEIIHAQWIFSACIAGLIKKICHKKVIYTIRGSDIHVIKKNKIYNRLLKIALENADYITANNKKQYELVRKKGYKNSALIYNGIDNDLFTKLNKKGCRKKTGLPVEKKIVLYVGWLEKSKGVDRLQIAIEKINKERKDILFVLVGRGKLEEGLKRSIGEGTENIKLIPQVEHAKMPLYMNAADILILPSEAEGMPNVVLEAMSCGTPVLVTDVGDVKEFVKENENGRIITTDPEDLAEKVMDTIDTVDLITWGKNARNTIKKKKLSWEKTVEKYKEIYREVLNE